MMSKKFLDDGFADGGRRSEENHGERGKNGREDYGKRAILVHGQDRPGEEKLTRHEVDSLTGSGDHDVLFT
ncbi:unnamed protein product [Bathycoccus prasinos]